MSYKTIVEGPLIGPEREWLPDMPNDNIASAILMASIEIARLQDELGQIKDVLRDNGLTLPDRDDAVSPEERAKIEREICGPIISRIVSELFRPQTSWTDVDPRVSEYFDG